MGSFRSVQRVYFDDLDALNILHNVRYLLFIERARGELFHLLGFRWDDAANEDKWHVVAAHTIEYLKPVTGEQEIAIQIDVLKVGNTSIALSARVSNTTGDIVYSTSTSRLVRLDPKTNRPCPWSARFRAAIAPFCG